MQSGVTAAATQTEFINLLVTQLQNQDPLEPVSQEEYLGQLAQFSTLEGIAAERQFQGNAEAAAVNAGCRLVGPSSQLSK